jgi:hypothetical protein
VTRHTNSVDSGLGQVVQDPHLVPACCPHNGQVDVIHASRSRSDLRKRQSRLLRPRSGWRDLNPRPHDPQNYAPRTTCENSDQRGPKPSPLPPVSLDSACPGPSVSPLVPTPMGRAIDLLAARTGPGLLRARRARGRLGARCPRLVRRRIRSVARHGRRHRGRAAEAAFRHARYC